MTSAIYVTHRLLTPRWETPPVGLLPADFATLAAWAAQIVER
ncbi:hypothetical protein [Streptacidiphilus sp. PAMC 29251]